MPSPREVAGLLRSLLIYYGQPLRHRRLLSLYRPFIPSGGLVFDAGAHAGNHTRAFLALGARTILVEPQPLFAAWLRRVYGRSPSATVVQAGLGAEAGDRQMHLSSLTPTVSTLNEAWRERVAGERSFSRVRWDRLESVRELTLDALIDAYGAPDFVKIDVEGSELSVLQGLSQPVPALSFEVLPADKDQALACIDRLESLGKYGYSWTEGERARLRPGWVGPEGAARYITGIPPGAREANLFACHAV